MSYIPLGQPVHTELWVDANTTLLLAQQKGTLDRPYKTVQQAVDHASAASEISWRINVAFGIYPDPINIPSNKTFSIEGPVRFSGSISLGNVTWTTTGNSAFRLSFRFIIVNNITIIDDVIPAVNAILVLFASNVESITTTGTSFITLIYSGTSLASFSGISTSLVSSVANGPIDLSSGGGNILAENVQFSTACINIKSSSLFANGCSFDQDIDISGTIAEISGSTWLSAKTVTFTGISGDLRMDESSAARFVESGSIIVNGDLLVETQRSTGWTNGGEVTRLSGLDLFVTSGRGYVFEFDDIVKYVKWEDSTITLPLNQLVDIVVDENGIVQSVIHPADERIYINLSTAFTNDTDVILLTRDLVETTQIVPQISQYLGSVIGAVHVTGLATTKHTPTSLSVDVDSGTYYIGLDRRQALSSSPVIFRYWYQNGLGGWTTVPSITDFDPDFYDDGSGTLAPLPAGKFKKDSLFLTVLDGGVPEYHAVYAQEVYNQQSEAEAGNLPNSSTALGTSAFRTAGIVLEQGINQIISITDERSRLNQMASGSTSTTDHGLLSGLADDDHPQYQLRSEKNTANGYAGLNGSTKLSGAQQVYGSIANTAVEGNDSRVPTQNENDALQGTNGSPSNTNRYVTNSDLQSRIVDFLLENDPSAPSNNYYYFKTNNLITQEVWKRQSDSSNIKIIDYTYNNNKIIQEVRQVYDLDGSTVLGKITIDYAYFGNYILTPVVITRNI